MPHRHRCPCSKARFWHAADSRSKCTSAVANPKHSKCSA
jgi:hypothetical protein